MYCYLHSVAFRLKCKPQSRKDHDIDAKQQKSDVWAMHLISSNEVINAEDMHT